MSELIQASSITGFLPEKYKNLPVTAFENIDSTNRVAKDLAAEGHALPLLVVADSQTAGRGRLGRNFYSPSSTGLYMSLAIGGFSAPQEALFITSAAAVAVTDAINLLTGKNPGIKWVNDIFLKDKKICGILAESQPTPSGFSVIVGVGLNMTTRDFPEDISITAGSLESDISREQMAAEIVTNLLEFCENPLGKSFLEKYKSRSILLGKEINYFSGGTMKTAIAKDIDQSCGLVVQDKNGSYTTLSSGEVTVRLK